MEKDTMRLIVWVNFASALDICIMSYPNSDSNSTIYWETYKFPKFGN